MKVREVIENTEKNYECIEIRDYITGFDILASTGRNESIEKYLDSEVRSHRNAKIHFKDFRILQIFI
jgi:hypothetical protein